MKTLFILSALAASLTASIATSPAAAQAPAAGDRLIVSYSDLDLSSRAGVRTLNRRILTAVQTACGSASDIDLRGRNSVNECRSATYAQANAQVRDAIALASRNGSTMVASGR
jgi:UrcA family protein